MKFVLDIETDHLWNVRDRLIDLSERTPFNRPETVLENLKVGSRIHVSRSFKYVLPRIQKTEAEVPNNR